MRDTILITLYVLSQLILISYEAHHYYPNFTDEEAETKEVNNLVQGCRMTSILHHSTSYYHRSP